MVPAVDPPLRQSRLPDVRLTLPPVMVLLSPAVFFLLIMDRVLDQSKQWEKQSRPHRDLPGASNTSPGSVGRLLVSLSHSKQRTWGAEPSTATGAEAAHAHQQHRAPGRCGGGSSRTPPLIRLGGLLPDFDSSPVVLGTPCPQVLFTETEMHKQWIDFSKI